MKFAVLLAASVFLCTGCEETASYGPPCSDVYLFRKPDASVQIGLNQTANLLVTSQWSNSCTVRAVDWTVAPSAVVRIQATSDTTAIVTGQSVGTATVIAQLRAYSDVKTHFQVVVSATN
jgi:Flp pilus assembly secretin CpaC